MNDRRRLALEALEPRFVLNALGLGGGPPGLDWAQVIVTLHESDLHPRAVAEEVVGRQVGAQLGHVYEHALQGFSAQLPAAAVPALGQHPLVKSVETDIVMHTFAQTVPTGVERIGTLESSIAGIGQGQHPGIQDVGIAIIDTGIDPNHPDLNVVGGRRFYTVSTGPPSNRGPHDDGKYADDNGHGTHVAGIAAAIDNGIGVVGVAPGAPLFAVKVLGASGSGLMSDIIRGVDWVYDNREHIAVANMSLGGTGHSADVRGALQTAIQKSVEVGIVYFAAAGNDWGDIYGSDGKFGTNDDIIPAAYPEVATISAFADYDGAPGGEGGTFTYNWGTQRDDAWWGPSNFSNSPVLESDFYKVESPGVGIDLVLPGSRILSTYLNGGYARASGTSMAAPHAAGLAALYIAANERAYDAAGVYAIRQALIDSGKAWNDPDYGLHNYGTDPWGNSIDYPWSPDRYWERLGWAGDQVVTPTPTLTVGIHATEDGVVDGEIVEGTVDLRAEAFDIEDLAIDRVDFLARNEDDDEITIGSGDTNSSDSWSLQWATAGGESLYPDGAYTVWAVAYDAGGGELLASASLTVEVDNVPAAPTVEIVSPTDGTVSGQVTITAQTTVDRRLEVSTFHFHVGDELVDSESIVDDGGGSYSYVWDTRDLDDGGDYVITVSVTDTGNGSAEDSITVTVSNPTGEVAQVDLEGWAQDINRNFWRAYASVEVTVGDGPLAGAEVTGQWTWNNTTQSVSGVTNSSGIVTFETGNLRINSVAYADFHLTGIGGFEEFEGDGGIRVPRSGSTVPLSASQADALFWHLAEEEAHRANAKAKPWSLSTAAVDHLMATQV